MSSLRNSLQSVTKALLVRNSRFAEDVLGDQTASSENPIIREHIRALAQLTLRINEEPQLKAYEDLSVLAETVIAMFDSPADRLKIAQEFFDRINKDVQIMMKKTPNNIHRGVNLILAANHYLEIAQCLTLFHI